jgi:hypothetical protein
MGCGDAAFEAALQVRWGCSVVVIDGRGRPVMALMEGRVEAEAAGNGKA